MEDNIKICLRDAGCGVVQWIGLKIVMRSAQTSVFVPLPWAELTQVTRQATKDTVSAENTGRRRTLLHAHLHLDTIVLPHQG